MSVHMHHNVIIGTLGPREELAAPHGHLRAIVLPVALLSDLWEQKNFCRSHTRLLAQKLSTISRIQKPLLTMS